MKNYMVAVIGSNFFQYRLAILQKHYEELLEVVIKFS